MKIYPFILVIIASTALSETNVQNLLKNGNDQFTAKLFHTISEEQADKSFVISAYSVMTPLAQLALASVGDSHNEILTAIGMPNDDVTKQVFSNLKCQTRSITGVELKQADKVYIRDGENLNKEFLSVSRSVFNTEVENINFMNSDAAADKINTWVEKNTDNYIKDLVDSSKLNADTTAFLVNTILFKGNWQSPFQNYSTQDGDFYVTKDQNVKIPMMHQTDGFRYDDNDELDAQLLELPYEGQETSFIAVLPRQKDCMKSLTEKLKDPAAFSKARNNMSITGVHVTLPKFEIETTTDLKEVLQKVDVKLLFEAGKAHLDNLVEGASDLYLSDAVQKTFIQVDEQGTTAAAANAFGVTIISDIIFSNYATFKADHPFVFYLMHEENILFNGVYQS